MLETKCISNSFAAKAYCQGAPLFWKVQRKVSIEMRQCSDAISSSSLLNGKCQMLRNFLFSLDFFRFDFSNPKKMSQMAYLNDFFFQNSKIYSILIVGNQATQETSWMYSVDSIHWIHYAQAGSRRARKNGKARVATHANATAVVQRKLIPANFHAKLL